MQSNENTWFHVVLGNTRPGKVLLVGRVILQPMLLAVFAFLLFRGANVYGEIVDVMMLATRP